VPWRATQLFVQLVLPLTLLTRRVRMDQKDIRLSGRRAMEARNIPSDASVVRGNSRALLLVVAA
jgi:hypothetical protein